MREIKFRGKRLDNGEWIFGDLMTDPGSGRCWISPVYYNLQIVEPETVGQFTGLKSDDGKEIFDGDIIEGYGEEICEGFVTSQYTCDGVVFWDDEYGGWNVKDYPSEEIYPLFDYEFVDTVIGNKWENPDLIA